jgi:flagellar basal-body rod protein FlgG
MTEEMTDLMLVQRAYQLSARSLSSSEQMMGMANNLRG